MDVSVWVEGACEYIFPADVIRTKRKKPRRIMTPMTGPFVLEGADVIKGVDLTCHRLLIDKAIVVRFR